MKSLRNSGRWRDVYKNICNIGIYPGIVELINELKSYGIPISIVTNSPSTYCNSILKSYDIDVDVCICYHDTQRHKPYPDPLLLAIDRMRVPINRVVSIGDAPNDILAAHNANIISIGTLWGTDNRQALINTNPNYLCNSVAELRDILLHGYNLIK